MSAKPGISGLSPPGGDYAFRIFIALFFIETSYLFATVGMWVNPLIFAGMYATIFYFLLACIVQRQFTPAIFFTVLSVFILLELFLFSRMSHFAMNYTAYSAFFGPLSLTITWYYVDTPAQGKLLSAINMGGIIYAAIFIILTLIGPQYLTSVLSADGAFMLIRDDPRGARMVLAGAAVIFAAIYSLIEFQRQKTPAALGRFLICVTALGMAQGRASMAILVPPLAVYFITRSRRKVAWVCVAMMCFEMAAYLYGFIDPSWNPFDLFQGDASALTRSQSYDVARLNLLESPILGLGYDSKVQNIYDFTGFKAFSASDLGVTGIYFYFGMPGIVLLFISALIACFTGSRIRKEDNPSASSEALFLFVCVLGGASGIMYALWFGDGSIFFSIVLAQFLKRWTNGYPTTLDPMIVPNSRAAVLKNQRLRGIAVNSAGRAVPNENRASSGGDI